MIEKDTILAVAYHASRFINRIEALDDEYQVACIRSFLDTLKLLTPNVTTTAVSLTIKEWEAENE